MTTEENDGVSQAVEETMHGTLTVAMTLAGRAGEEMARGREAALREAAARSEQAAAELSGRYAAERDAARAALAPVHRPEWWDSAQGEDITRAYQTARAWADGDPEAVRAQQRIIEEVRNRFGAEVAGAGSVGEAVDRSRHAYAAADAERAAALVDEREAAALMLAAGEADRRAQGAGDAEVGALDEGDPIHAAALTEETRIELATEQETRDTGEVAYDSAERRRSTARGYDQIGNEAAVDARVRADVAQGAPATEATHTGGPRPVPARPARSTRVTRQAARGR